MNQIILTDTCFWLGLLDPRDQHHYSSTAIADVIENNEIIIPWPCMYETVSTHLVRRREKLIIFEEYLNKPNIVLFEDTDYKFDALREVFEINRKLGYTYSLVDSVIREILKDVNVRINYLVTFNEKDFKDLCDQRLIEIINNT